MSYIFAQFRAINILRKFLHSVWLRAVHLSLKTVQKRVNLVQKEVTNQAFWRQEPVILKLVPVSAEMHL